MAFDLNSFIKAFSAKLQDLVNNDNSAILDGYRITLKNFLGVLDVLKFLEVTKKIEMQMKEYPEGMDKILGCHKNFFELAIKIAASITLDTIKNDFLKKIDDLFKGGKRVVISVGGGSEAEEVLNAFTKYENKTKTGTAAIDNIIINAIEARKISEENINDQELYKRVSAVIRRQAAAGRYRCVYDTESVAITKHLANVFVGKGFKAQEIGGGNAIALSWD